jgi:hypothetical protein
MEAIREGTELHYILQRTIREAWKSYTPDALSLSYNANPEQFIEDR